MNDGNGKKLIITAVIISLPSSIILFLIMPIEYKISGILIGWTIGGLITLALLHGNFFTKKQDKTWRSYN